MDTALASSWGWNFIHLDDFCSSLTLQPKDTQDSTYTHLGQPHSLNWLLLLALHMLWPCLQAPCWASMSSTAAPISHMHYASWPNPVSVSKTNFHRPWLWTSFLLSISAASWASPARTHHHPNPEQKEDSCVTFVTWGDMSI